MSAEKPFLIEHIKPAALLRACAYSLPVFIANHRERAYLGRRPGQGGEQ
jgi:hypothetical protein